MGDGKLQGIAIGWEPLHDREDRDNKSAPLVTNQSESISIRVQDVVSGTKRKAEDQADDSERRHDPRLISCEINRLQLQAASVITESVAMTTGPQTCDVCVG